MFRRWPFFQRLLSWTKPYAPTARRTRAYERYDWNSLIDDDAGHRAIQAELMDGSSYFPSRPEMEASIATFAARTGLSVRYGCRWESTRQLDDGRFELVTSDGVYTAGTLILAVGVAEPYRPATPGMELAAHYADTRPAETYADKRVFIIGKQNSGFELASGAAALGPPDRPRLAQPGQAVGQHPLAGRDPGALPPAVRGPRAGRRGRRARCVDRGDRADRRRDRVRRPDPSVRWRPRDGLRGRRGDRRDRLHGPAAGPAGPRGGDLRAEPAARPDALLGERHGARHLLRRDHRPGRQGSPEARHPGQLRGRPRRPVQRPLSGRARRPDPVHGRARVAGDRRLRAGRVHRHRADSGPGDLEPAGVPGPDRRAGSVGRRAR